MLSQKSRAAEPVRFPPLALPKLELLFKDGSTTWLHQARGTADPFVREVDDGPGRLRVDLRQISPTLEACMKDDAGALVPQRDRAAALFFGLRVLFPNAAGFMQAAREHAQ